MEDELMAKSMLTDELWAVIEPCLPPPQPRPQGGRPPVPNRNALTGILFVLKTGIPWEDVPQAMGCGCGMTCWRRLRDWQEAGVWQDIFHILLNRLQEADRIDWSRAVVDSSSVRAVFGGRRLAPTLRIAAKTDRSITSSPMRTVFPWPRPLPARIATM
jgi:transposase